MRSRPPNIGLHVFTIHRFDVHTWRDHVGCDVAGVNIGGSQKLSMAALRTLCTSLGLQDVQSYIQSGNLVFHEALPAVRKAGTEVRGGRRSRASAFGAAGRMMATQQLLTHQGEREESLCWTGRHRTQSAARRFMDRTPTKQARDQLLGLPCEPEELRINGREVYIYYPQGMAHPKVPLSQD